MPVSPRAVAHLTAAGHDAVHAHSIGLATAAGETLAIQAPQEILGSRVALAVVAPECVAPLRCPLDAAVSYVFK